MQNPYKTIMRNTQYLQYQQLLKYHEIYTWNDQIRYNLLLFASSCILIKKMNTSSSW